MDIFITTVGVVTLEWDLWMWLSLWIFSVNVIATVGCGDTREESLFVAFPVDSFIDSEGCGEARVSSLIVALPVDIFS